MWKKRMLGRRPVTAGDVRLRSGSAKAQAYGKTAQTRFTQGWQVLVAAWSFGTAERAPVSATAFLLY
jgi:hypothetical protein